MKVRIGVDPYVSSGDDFKLIKEVITSLHREGIYEIIALLQYHLIIKFLVF
jgi:hypothetical protein